MPWGIPAGVVSRPGAEELTRRDATDGLRLDDAAWGIVQVPRLGVEASGPPLASLGSRRIGPFALISGRVGVRRHGVGVSGGRSHGAVALKGRRGPGPGEAQRPGRGPVRKPLSKRSIRVRKASALDHVSWSRSPCVTMEELEGCLRHSWVRGP